MERAFHHVLIDTVLVCASIVVAVLLARSEFLPHILHSFSQYSFATSFFAGLGFTSVFTTAPATIVLGELTQTASLATIALWGGLGALAGDLALFAFIRQRLAEDMRYIIRASHLSRVDAIFKTRLARWATPLLGALIIASPLPDEIGITLLGLSEIPAGLFVLVSFACNTVGIVLVALFAHMVL